MTPRLVTSDRTIRQAGEQMRRAAQHKFVTSEPVYSKTEAEAFARTAPVRRQLMENKALQALVFPPDTLVSLVLTVDAFDTRERWHLSMSRIVPLPSGEGRIERVPDALAKRVVKYVLPEATEGPPEGAFKDVRHFFLSYQRP